LAVRVVLLAREFIGVACDIDDVVEGDGFVFCDVLPC